MPGKKPLYVRISEELLDKYGHLDYYSPLPGERELCDVFHTSRPTIRKAVNLLEEDGKIVRLQGKGTFFVGEKTHIAHETNKVIGFYNDLRLQGKKTNSKVLLQNMEKADAFIAQQLEIEEGELVFHLERLRYIDGELYNLTNSYHPVKYFPELYKEDYSETSLYDTFEKMGVFIKNMRQVLEVKPADEYEAIHLGIKEGEPISLRSCVTYDLDDRIIEYVQIKTQAYKTKFEIMVNRY